MHVPHTTCTRTAGVHGYLLRFEPLSPHARRLLVLVEITLQCERFPAPPTNVWFLSWVGLNVRAQVGLVSEGFPARAAREGLLPSVRAHVTLEQPRSTELLTTVPAFTALSMGPHVHTVGGHGDIHLLAVWTLSCFLVCGCSMGLSVPG